MIQQYLTFKVENTRYAINVFKIQEVLEYEEPQQIPCSSPLLTGIIRSRDTNIAIMDLRKKFGLGPKIPGTETRTIVLEVVDQDSGVINLYGIVADEVFEVIDLDDSYLEPLPSKKNFSGAQFVSSVFTQNDIYTLVLDVSKIFSEEELSTTATSDPIGTSAPIGTSDPIAAKDPITTSNPKTADAPKEKKPAKKTSRRTK